MQFFLHSLKGIWIGVALALAGNVAMAGDAQPMTSERRATLRAVFGYNPTDEFTTFDTQYREKHRRYVMEVEDLQRNWLGRLSKGGPPRVRGRFFWMRAG